MAKYKVDASLNDDAFVLASVEEALEALKDGEFGIGAALVKDGEIILRAHNSQLSNKRSDLHAEMTLINMFENHPELKKHRKLFNIDENIVLYSSTEPCPMCLTRIAICELASKYGAGSDLDGMAHLMFYSFLFMGFS